MVEDKGKVVSHIKNHTRATKAHVSPPIIIKAKANPNAPTTKEKGKAKRKTVLEEGLHPETG